MPAPMTLTDLHLTPLLQSRSGGLNPEAVADYAAAVQRGESLPPLLAYRIIDRAWKQPALVAGFHRYEACQKAGVAEYPVEVREGTFAEAWLAGYLSNRNNGVRYTTADKRKAAETGLLLWKEDSARAIADRLLVSHDLVTKVRTELVAVGKLDQPEKVKGKDGRTTPAKVKRKNKDESPLSSDYSGFQQRDDNNNQSPTGDTGVSSVDGRADGPSARVPASPPLSPSPAPQLRPGGAPAERDGLGNVLPSSLVDTFCDPTLPAAADRVKALHDEVVSLEGHLVRVIAPKTTEFFPYVLCGAALKSLRAAADRLAEAWSQLDAGVPWCICPKCKGEGCKDCRNCGLWPRHRWDARDQYEVPAK